MQPDAAGRFARDDHALRAEAIRKGKGSNSRLTGRAVSQSRESVKIRGQLMPGVSVAFDLVAPPVIEASRAYDLAHLQLSAFFYWLSFDSTLNRGGHWPGEYFTLRTSLRSESVSET